MAYNDLGKEAVQAAYESAFAAAQPSKNKATLTDGLVPQQRATTADGGDGGN